MNPGLWIFLIAISAIGTFVCGYNSICSIEAAITWESTDARKPAVLWTLGAALSLLALMLTIFGAS